MTIKVFIKLVVHISFCFSLFTSYSTAQERNIKQAIITDYKSLSIKNEGNVLKIGLGYTYKDREKWEILYNSGRYKKVMAGAEKILKEGIPAWSDNSYLSYSKGVASEVGKDMMTTRILALAAITWAECLENKGRFVSSINNALLELSKQKSWVFPSQDSKLLNFKGKSFSIDLCSANYANHLGQALYLLDDKIRPEVREKVVNALQKRIFDPFFKLAQSSSSKKSFLTETSNWNPVCLAGVVGAALAVSDDVKIREKIVNIASVFSRNYLESFLDDGYCSEGVDYYNYGFGNYLVLREELYRSTKGKIDVLKGAKVEKAARFLTNIIVVNGLYPSIGDSPSKVQPSYFILNYLNNKSLLPQGTTLQSPPLGMTNINLTIALLDGFLNLDKKRVDSKLSVANESRLSSFENAGVFILRSSSQKTNKKFGILIKGGNNNEHHNHNDLGSYTIAVGSTFLMGDPGKASYTKNSFGSNRYKYKTMSSYGHPVPTIDGQFQKEGLSAVAKVVTKSFSSQNDRIVFDLGSAYPTKELSKLEREFNLDRGNSSFVVKTTFDASKPIIFEDAVITKAKFTKTGPNSFSLRSEGSTVKFIIESSGIPLHISTEKIDEGKNPFQRISIKSVGKYNSGYIMIKYII